jgi:hypothetical protein
MMRLAAAGLWMCLPAALSAQVVPGLGADRFVGTAGVEAVAPLASVGLPPNPAAIGGSGRWSLGFGLATASVTDVVERSLGAGSGAIRILAGLAACPTEHTRAYREAGVIADIGWFQLQLGIRFGADPVPGTSFRLSAALHGA